MLSAQFMCLKYLILILNTQVKKYASKHIDVRGYLNNTFNIKSKIMK